MLKTMLVPLNGSLLAECVLPHAVAIAKAFDAQITLMNVLDQSIDPLRKSIADPLDWYLQNTEAGAYLDSVKTRLEKNQVSVRTVLPKGHAIEQIVEMSHTGDVDLLILSDYGRYDDNSWSISGIVQQVIQRTRTSTLIIRAQHSSTVQVGDLHYRRLLVPLDGSRRAGSALPFATVLVQAHHADLMLVHVVSKPEMARQMPLTQEDLDLMNRFVERNQDEGNKYLEQIRAQLPVNAETRLLISDNIAATLQNFSEQEQIDLLILSAHGYSGEAKWPYGSITNRFITDGTMPLLIVQDLPNEASETTRDNVTVRQTAR
jgi:nucleotide-binding universal stress UspA family protein